MFALCSEPFSMFMVKNFTMYKNVYIYGEKLQRLIYVDHRLFTKQNKNKRNLSRKTTFMLFRRYCSNTIGRSPRCIQSGANVLH